MADKENAQNKGAGSHPLPYGQFTPDIQRFEQGGGSANLNDVVSMLNSINRRLRILEDRYSNLRRKTQVTDQNMLSNTKRFMNEIREINESIKEAKKDIYDMKEKMDLFVKELETCARAEDVKMIENYVNLWLPVKFVTQNEARSLIRGLIRSVFQEMDSERNGRESETLIRTRE